LKDGFFRVVCCCSNLWVDAIWELTVRDVTTSHIECVTVGALWSMMIIMVVISVIMVRFDVASAEVVAVRQLLIAARKKRCASVVHLRSESKLLAVKCEGITVMIKIMLRITA